METNRSSSSSKSSTTEQDTSNGSASSDPQTVAQKPTKDRETADERNDNDNDNDTKNIKTVNPEVLPPEEEDDGDSKEITQRSESLSERLSPEERQEFTALDSQLQKSFIHVAIALKVIKEKHLYREEFTSFENYCEDRIGRSRRYVDYMVLFATIRQILEHNVPPRLLPTSEAQVRPLGKYKDNPEKCIEVWRKGCEIAGDAVPSREQVYEADQELREKTSRSKTTTRPALKEGDYVRLTKAYKDEEQIKALMGYWGHVEKVYKKGTFNVRFPQQTLEKIPRDALTKIKEQTEEQQQQHGDADRGELFETLHAIYDSKQYREPIVEANLSLLGKKKDATCTSLEKELLAWLLEHLKASSEN